MNKRNFVFNYVPLKSDFDDLQNDMEGGIKDVAKAVAGMGILSGLEVSIASSEATISPGVAYDGQGNRIELKQPLRVNIGSITRPSAGKYKWVTLALRYVVASEGQVIDGNNKSWPARLLDSYSALLLEGSEGTAAAAVKPTFEDWQVPLVDIRVDPSSPWENLVTETNRRPILIPIATASADLESHKTRTGRNTHGATPEAIADQIVVRDENGRAKIASPAAADDIARKDTVEAHAALTNNPHSVTKSHVGLARLQNIDPLSWTVLWTGIAKMAQQQPYPNHSAIFSGYSSWRE